MHVLANSKGFSTFVTIILMLCSLVLGGLVSYLLVMASYYNMPENTTILVVTEAVFPITDATYFNVTVLNPSNSVSDANITGFRLTVEGIPESYNVTAEDSELLPFLIRKGTKQTFNCTKNWSALTGQTVRIEPVANASAVSYSCVIPMVKLNLSTTFNETDSVEYFDLFIENSVDSVINLTLAEILLFAQRITENVTPPLTPPIVLAHGQGQMFKCAYNWGHLVGTNITIMVNTAEGYESVHISNTLLGASLIIDEVRFDYTDTSFFDLTVKSSEDSTTTAYLNNVDLTIRDEPAITLNTTPPLNVVPVPLSPNQSLAIRCLWDWNTHRDETIRVRVYTKQGFIEPSRTALIPSRVVWNISYVEFDLDHTEYFLVNITNMLCSLQEINVTRIEFDQNTTVMNSSIIIIGGETTFTCEYNWSDSVGREVSVTAYTTYDGNESSISHTLTLPYLKVNGTSFSNFPQGNPYVNITIFNSVFSITNANITQIFIETENKTYSIDGTLTIPELSPEYQLVAGKEITIICPWNWEPYLDQNVTIIVQTVDGYKVSKTVQVQQTPP